MSEELKVKLADLVVTGPVWRLEFRSAKDEPIKWTDNKTGKAMTMNKRTVFCEPSGGEGQVAVEMFPERGGDGALPPLPDFLKKGVNFFCVIEGMQVKNGSVSVRAASFHPV